LSAASDVGACLRIETSSGWFAVAPLRLAHPVRAVMVCCCWREVLGCSECGVDVGHESFCSLQQFVIGDLILFQFRVQTALEYHTRVARPLSSRGMIK